MFDWLTCFHVCFEIAQVFFRLTGCRVYKGHFQNEWVIKTCRKHPKSRKIVCIKSGLHFMHNLYPFCRNSKISRDSSYRFLWNFAQQKTSTQSKHTANSRKVVGKKCASTIRGTAIWDMTNTLFLTTVAVDPTFVAFLLALANICP